MWYRVCDQSIESNLRWDLTSIKNKDFNALIFLEWTVFRLVKPSILKAFLIIVFMTEVKDKLQSIINPKSLIEVALVTEQLYIL